LRPVKKRAVQLLTGQPRKPRKNIIEKRAICLVESIQRVWSPTKRKSKDATRPIQLTITALISVAVPVIEEFAQKPIAFHKRGSDSDPPSFEALYSIVSAFAKDGAACNKSTVNGLLRRFRKRIPIEDVRVYIAPELRGWFD
jgi:hypothetical protein